MAQSLMLLGTHSHAGKSLLATAFCRILAQKGSGSGMDQVRAQAYDRLADVVVSSVDWDRITALMGI